MAKEPTWAEAIRIVLAKSPNALHYNEIADVIAEQAVRKSLGATPAQTVANTLSTSLKDKGSPFLRVGQGQYTLKEKVTNPVPAQNAISDQGSTETETGALRAFGMFWQRSSVVWNASPKLLGRQNTASSTVNFAAQIGVYLLHDRERVIYVGRAQDTLATRLKAHIGDRLGGRWDRFSWFGLRSVAADGTFSDNAVPWKHSIVIETMEALLIECLEPPLNRKRGDKLSAIEYIQAVDPELETLAKKRLMEELISKAGWAG